MSSNYSINKQLHDVKSQIAFMKYAKNVPYFNELINGVVGTVVNASLGDNESDIFSIGINGGGQTGPTGPQGNVGPTGPTGPTGPSASPPFYIAITNITTPSYEVSPSDFYLGVEYQGECVITLPLGLPGMIFVIKDEYGNANNFPITIVATNSETIDGAVNATISSNYASLTIIFNGENWFLI